MSQPRRLRRARHQALGHAPIEPWYRGGKGEPLVLIHGFATSWRAWRPVLPALEERHDVLAIGLPGHIGCAPLPDDVEPSIEALTDALEARLDELGVAEAHLVGNSLGGWLALELAKRGRARSVVAIAPAGGWHPEQRVRRLAWRFRVARRLCVGLMPHAARLAQIPRVRHLFMRAAVARPEHLSADDVLHALHAVVACSIYRPLLATIHQGPAHDLHLVSSPVLLAWPEHDRLLPVRRHAARYLEEIPRAEFALLPQVGHVPMSDDPDLVARTILDFVDRHSGTERGGDYLASGAGA